ncbi:MAG: aspartate kinase [Anaerolineaceae bacterium]|nr:aspartate kinase [Anaerolineaceae bacterium]
MAQSPDKQNTLVMKFGGTSVGSIAAYKQVIQIVADAKKDWSNVVVVISAMSGITNLLIESAQQASQCNDHCYEQAARTLTQKHNEILDALVHDELLKQATSQSIQALITDFSNFCQAISVLGEATPRAMDAVVSLGERMNVRLLSAILQSAGIKSQCVESSTMIITDHHFQSARPDLAETKIRTQAIIHPLLEADIVPVITGFIGATPQGVTTTLGRGGSDYSAAIIGISLEADAVWVWTDVDGIMTADPRMVDCAQTLPELTYSEVAEMANFGAKVLHPKTIHPIVQEDITLRVCNTFNPKNPGTIITSDEHMDETGKMKAVATISGLKLITIKGHGMLGVPGVASRILAAVATTRASVPLITEASSEQSICFAISMELADQAVQAIQNEMAAELNNKDIDSVSMTDEVVIVTLVGPGMRNTVGIAGKIFMTLADHQINVISISYGASDLSLSLVVQIEDLEKAVKALHTLIC